LLYRKQDANLAVIHTAISVGCADLEIFVRPARFTKGVTVTDDSLSLKESSDEYKQRKVLDAQIIWKVKKIASVDFKPTPHLIWMGSSPGWYASDLAAIGLSLNHDPNFASMIFEKMEFVQMKIGRKGEERISRR
jgi:hypothetical protein